MNLIGAMIDEFNRKHGLVKDFSEVEKSAHNTSVKVKRLHPDAVIPTKAHAHDAGFDLVAVEDTIIEPGETALIKTGLAFELPPGYAMDIRPRSGITLKTKLRVQYGTVDCNYRGEIGVIVDNISPPFSGYTKPYIYGIDGEIFATQNEELPLFTYIIRKGDRIAQAVIHRLPDVEIIEVEALGDSDRGVGGFGSTGVRDTDKDNDFLEAFQEYQGEEEAD